MKPLLFCLVAVMPAAALRNIHIVERADIAAERPFGAAGAFERIAAKASFAADIRDRLPACPTLD